MELRILQAPRAAGDESQSTAAPASAKPATGIAPAIAPVPGGAHPAAHGKEVPNDGLGPAAYSQLGPPRPVSRDQLIVPEGGWASLYEQLRQRREQLAQNAAKQPAAAVTPHTVPLQQADDSGLPGTAKSAPPTTRSRSSAEGIGGRGASLTPGATRPRAGVRRTALGPILRMLRDAQELS